MRETGICIFSPRTESGSQLLGLLTLFTNSSRTSIERVSLSYFLCLVIYSMRHQDPDFAHIITVVLLLAVIGLVVGVFVNAMPNSSAGFESLKQHLGLTEEPPAPVVNKNLCRSVMKNCKFRIELKTEHCKESKARQQLESSLGNPLDSPECQQVEQEMAQDCALGCRLDYNSLMVIPGKLKADFSAEKDESGQCLIKGRRTITLEARCVPATPLDR